MHYRDILNPPEVMIPGVDLQAQNIPLGMNWRGVETNEMTFYTEGMQPLQIKKWQMNSNYLKKLQEGWRSCSISPIVLITIF